MQREPSTRTGVYYIDVIVAIFMIIAGVLISVIGVDYVGQLGTGAPISAVASAWLIVIGGLASIIYGIKRMIDDVTKAMAQ